MSIIQDMESSSYRTTVRWSALITGAIGGLVLIGWVIDNPYLKAFHPSLVSMKVNTALCFLFAGVAVWLKQFADADRWSNVISRTCAVVVTGVAGATLLQYIFGFDFGIDQLIIRESVGAVGTSNLGRMAPATAFLFFILGATITLQPGRIGSNLAQFTAPFALVVSLLSIVGYAYDVTSLRGIPGYTVIALHTALAFVVLSTGVVASSPQCRLMIMLTRSATGARLLYRTLPIAGVTLVLFGWVRLEAERAGLFSSDLGGIFYTVASLVTLTVVIISSTVSLSRVEAERRRIAAERDRFFDQSLDLLCIAGTDGMFKRINQAWSKTLGHSTEELLSEPYLTFVHPEDRESTIAAASELAEGRDVVSFENRYRKRDGSYVWLNWVCRAPDKENSFIFATAHDITERKHAEQSLQDFKAALDEHAIVAITDGRGTITYVNDKFCAISKYSREELVGQDHRIMNAGYHSKEFIRELWQTVTSGRVWKGEIKNRAKDGTFSWMDTTIVPFLDARGEPFQYVTIRTDITDRKNAESALQQAHNELEVRVAERTAELTLANARLESATVFLRRHNRELQEFVYVASHDLQEPLRKIEAFGGRLRDRCATILSDESRDYLERILSATSRMQTLIEDLLVLSRVSTQARPFASVDLTQIARGVLSDLESRLDQTGGQIELTPLPTIEADATQMRQLLQNLIGNALKFHRPGVAPLVKVHSAPGSLPHRRAGLSDSDVVTDSVRILIEDNGIGFEEKYLDRIFQPFQRLHGRTEYGGTGIGLAICQKIVERHNGAITAYSTPGSGSQFVVTLPISHASEGAHSWMTHASQSEYSLPMMTPTTVC